MPCPVKDRIRPSIESILYTLFQPCIHNSLYGVLKLQQASNLPKGTMVINQNNAMMSVLFAAMAAESTCTVNEGTQQQTSEGNNTIMCCVPLCGLHL